MVSTPDFQGSKHAREANALLEVFKQFGGTQETSTIREWLFENHPGLFSIRSLGQYLRGCSVNAPIAISYHKDFPRFLYRCGHGQFELYDLEKHGEFDENGHKNGESPGVLDKFGELEEEIAEDIEASKEFAKEAHLKEYLAVAKNLEILEKGLTFWTGSAKDSMEYQLSGGCRIDIFAKDSEGTPVVIELKKSKGAYQTVGQALYYRSKVRQQFGASKVRVIIVAGEIEEKLRLASAEVDRIDLFSYALAVEVKKINKLS